MHQAHFHPQTRRVVLVAYLIVVLGMAFAAMLMSTCNPEKAPRHSLIKGSAHEAPETSHTTPPGV